MVLTREEVRAVLQGLEGVPRVMAYLLYGAGLRVLECCRLRVQDIDFGANQIVVRSGKGDKDRVTVLPSTVKVALARHLSGMREPGRAEVARRAGQGEIGQLVVGVVPTVDTRVFTRILRAFAGRYPRVQVAIRSVSTTAQVQGLRAGTLHAGFLRLPIRDDALTFRLVSREPLIAAVPARHALARAPRLSLAALANEPHVIFPRQIAPGYYDLIVSLYREAGLHLRITQEAEHVQTILGLVAGGFGVSLQPGTVRSLRPLGVVFRDVTGRLPRAETALAYRKDDPSEVLRAFVAVVDRASARLPR